ncbi:MAG: hypothetical protein ABJG88_06905 [Litorimonas sp.]
MKQLITSSKTLKPLFRQVLQAPWASPLMEFRYGVWVGVSGLMGEDARQLGEANTRPKVFNQNIPAEVQACKYQGTRYGKNINISALRVAMKHFYEAASITVAVRDYHMKQLGKPVSETPGAWDLYVISRAAVALISYRYRYGKTSLNEQVPNDLSSLYKLVTGVFVIIREMTRAAYSGIKENEPFTGKWLYQYGDENYMFSSAENMVCAGSVAKITEFLELLIQGKSHANGGNLALKGEDDYLAFLQNYVPDLDGWYRYALLTIELDHFIALEVMSRQNAETPAEAEKQMTVRDIYAAQHAYFTELIGDSAAELPVDFKSGILHRQNAILDSLKRPSIKQIPKKVIDLRLNQ